MKIFECCPFNNENIIAKIKLEENKKWIDELHITECNRTFKNGKKEFNFNINDRNIIKYHKVNVEKKFKNENLKFKVYRKFWTVLKNTYNATKYDPSWYNDAFQRNLSASWVKNIEDDDIIILSDIDEIIDSRYKEKIIEEVKKRGIVTIKIHFTLFYFNLFSKNWGGAPDYSYRIFIMTGKYFKNMKMTPDQLRKAGENGRLINDIFCFDEIMGFHHSWLGDEDFVYNKLKSYAHSLGDHDNKLIQNSDYNKNYIKERIKSGKSIFPGHELYVDNNVNFLEYIEKNRESNLDKYFIK